MSHDIHKIAALHTRDLILHMMYVIYCIILQFNSTILMLKILENSTRSSLSEILTTLLAVQQQVYVCLCVSLCMSVVLHIHDMLNVTHTQLSKVSSKAI